MPINSATSGAVDAFGRAACLLALAGVSAPIAARAQFIPPAGYSGTPGPAVAKPADPGIPRLRARDPVTIRQRIRLLPGYANAAKAQVKLVGAYTVDEPRGARFVDAWALGFLPVHLKRSDGICFDFGAQYVGGALSEGRLRPIGCDAKRIVEKPRVEPPQGAALDYISTAWGYSAWRDAKAAETLVTPPSAKTFDPLFAIRMDVFAIAAMNGPDWLGGNVTLVGRLNGQLTIIVLEISY